MRQIQSTITYTYNFKLSDGTEKEFKAVLDGRTLSLISDNKTAYPDWTKLSYMKCANCPLNEAEHALCPIASQIVDIVDFFKNSISFEEVIVRINDGVREYSKRTQLENGISSLIGIYMVTSGCPIMEKLRPMVRFHMPFATLEETRYRVLSMYVFSQYLIEKKGGTPDWELKGLSAIYDDVRVLNKCFLDRLHAAIQKDANANALVKLDCFAVHVSLLIDKRSLDEITYLFNAYLK